ncbi:MAG: bifunctional diaminohydroxyphosphoribosylaminopyrimidine deaminase/5-amino-6-(5-phosphoribosylamino)uracil reductase RibD [Paraclostridium sp.]
MDEFYMNVALSLAKKGMGRVNPNPLVGAVIVKGNKIIGEGYHEEYGKNHAEVNAINSSTESVEGATMYVTLEPCSHFGKTPPCVDKIIESKVKRVVIASIDHNELVGGNGIKKLQQAGIEVSVGILDKENKKLNEVFIKYIVKKQPFVIMKTAMSLDGKIATYTGNSKYISCEESRKEVQNLRNIVSGIMVGVDTVIKDDPMLTCRIPNGKNPIRIVVDSSLRTPINSNLIKTAKEVPTIIVTTDKAKEITIKAIADKGVKVIITKSKDNKVDLKDMMIKLGELKIDSILLEGGASLNFSALKENIVDKVQVYIAPKIIGGKDAKTSVEGIGVNKLEEAFKLRDMETRMIGKDIFIEGYIGR